MAANKIVVNNETLIDLTKDSIKPSVLFDGETAHDASGNEITGTFSLDSEITQQDDLILRIKTALQGKAAGGGSGGDSDSDDVAALLMNTLVTLDNSNATSIRSRACQGATKLVTVNLPSVTSIGTYAFYGCTALVTVNLPQATSVPSQAFYNCTKLQHADCGQAGSIAAQAFNACSVLTELILRKTGSICTLSNANGVSNTPIGRGTGYVYVPQNLLEQYTQAANWSTFAAQFRAIEDYPNVCG